MYNTGYNPLPLYRDAECLQAVPYREEGGRILYEAMAFTKLDGGESAVSDFYIRNASMGVVEDLSIEVESVNVEEVSVELASPSPVSRLAVKDVYHGMLRWTALEGVSAGPCLARIKVEGMLTQE